MKIIKIYPFIQLLISIFIFNSNHLLSKEINKVLILIIATDDTEYYQDMQKIWKLYMNSNPNHIEAYFLKADPNLPKTVERRGDTIWTKTSEVIIPGCMNKTIMAMKYLMPKMNEFDYVVRTNLSTFFIFPKLMALLENLPRKNCYYGKALGVPSYASGAGIILSSDLVQLMVENMNELWDKHPIIDDILVSQFLAKYGIELIEYKKELYFSSLESWETQKNSIPEDTVYFRTKNNFQHLRYTDEIRIQSEMLEKFYHIQFLNQKYKESSPPVLLEKYKLFNIIPSNYNQHLPILRSLSNQCSSVMEIGVQTMIPTWGLLQGLSENGKTDSRYCGIYFDKSSIVSHKLVRTLSLQNGVSFNLEPVDSKEFTQLFDLVFIAAMDRRYSYTQLFNELNTLCVRVNRYFVIHGTSHPYEHLDQGKRGVWLAIANFLKCHPEWKLKHKFENNFGLVVLERVKY
jgi:hypothetical protein